MYYANLGHGMGSEQEGRRPVLIIQNDVGNKYSSTVIVAAISSKGEDKKMLPTHFAIDAGQGLKVRSMALLEQIRTIDKNRLEDRVGKLTPEKIRELNRALAVSVGLVEPRSKEMMLCLCPICADNFYSTGAFYLQRVDPHKTEKEVCTYCNHRRGFVYKVISRK